MVRRACRGRDAERVPHDPRGCIVVLRLDRHHAGAGHAQAHPGRGASGEGEVRHNHGVRAVRGLVHGAGWDDLGHVVLRVRCGR